MPLDTLRSFKTGAAQDGKFHSLPELEKQGLGRISRLPVSIRLVLESLLRNCDGKRVAEPAIRDLAGWNAQAPRTEEIPFVVARIVLQDFTGVPAVVDLAALRNAATELGIDPHRINPQVPADLVIDHSVQVDRWATREALEQNVAKEYERNTERYQLLRWAQGAFDKFRVVPPGAGIVHQVNLEFLGRVVFENRNGSKLQAYPDTLVGTDSHTTMINGLGVLGWGVGGIEAEAAMLGQPSTMLIPEVIGVKLTGRLREGATATDLVLTVTELLRKRGVVEKFVEFFGDGLGQLPLADRRTSILRQSHGSSTSPSAFIVASLAAKRAARRSGATARSAVASQAAQVDLSGPR